MLTPCASSAEISVTLTNGEWPPITSEELPHGGIFSQLCRRAFELEGVKVDYSFMPWKRAMIMAENNEYAGTVAWRKDPAWEQKFYYSDPVFFIKTVFYHQKGKNFDWKELSDVGGMRIGVTRGFLFIEKISTVLAVGGGKLDIANDNITSMKKLAEGRIDLFPCAQRVADYLIQTQLAGFDSSRIKAHPKPLMQGELYLLINRKMAGGQKLIDIFNRGLHKLRNSGEYDRIVSEWDSIGTHALENVPK